MSVTIHLIRHGQGLHNVGGGNYQLPDPVLTPKGEAQCVALREQLFRNQSHISLIASSPMTRAIQSTAIIFEPTLQTSERPSTVLVLPDAQEMSDDPCDIGSDISILKAISRANRWPVDLSHIQPGWTIKDPGTRYSPSSRAISRRARDLRIFFREYARKRIAAGERDVHIALVAHGGFMHYFTGDWEGAEKGAATGWVNCEMRSYTFAQGLSRSADGDAHLDELMSSRRRRGMGWAMLGMEEQKVMYERAMQAWEDMGLQNHSKVDDGEVSD